MKLQRPPKPIVIPDTWTGDEALVVASLLEAMLQAVRQRYDSDLFRARCRHADLLGEPAAVDRVDDLLEGEFPF